MESVYLRWTLSYYKMFLWLILELYKKSKLEILGLVLSRPRPHTLLLLSGQVVDFLYIFENLVMILISLTTLHAAWIVYYYEMLNI